MPFQTVINTQPAPGIAGDFASANPRASVLAGPNQLVAGAAGVVVGRFAWIDPANQTLVANTGPFGTAPTGFVHREQQALITTYLAETSNAVPAGFGITLMSAGDYWVLNDGAGEILVGGKVYANYADGKVGGAATTATATSFTISAATYSVTGSIAGNVLTVTAVGSGTIYNGSVISGSSVATNTQIVSQISGTTGGVGTYYVNIPDQTVASTTISGTYGLLTLTTVATGTFAVGQTLSGTSVVAGTFIGQNISGSGSGSTWAVSLTTTASSGTITAASNIATKYIAMTAAPAGGLFKMSSWLLG